MRLALIADIHGNPIALDAVLEELNGRVDALLDAHDRSWHPAVSFNTKFWRTS